MASWIIGLGLILFVWHNPYQPLLQYAFLPWIGVILLVFGTMIVIGDKHKKLELGDKKLWIPLAILASCIAASGIEAAIELRTKDTSFFGAITVSMMFFGLYLASRRLGDKIFKPMAAAVVIESISLIVWAGTHDWQPNGGLLSPTNYDIATGLIVFGVLVSPTRHQWWLATVGTVGLFFSGSAEAIFIGGVMLIVILVRRAWSWKLAIPIGTLALTIAVTIPIGIAEKVQAPSIARLNAIVQTVNQTNAGQKITQAIPDSIKQPVNKYLDKITQDWTYAKWVTVSPDMPEVLPVDNLIGYRLTHWKLTMPVKPFGYGINLTKFYWGIPHNIFLIIIEQAGILALLAWLVVAYKGLRSASYIWIGFIVMGIFDHFIWTQAAPWFWALAGVSSISNIKAI